MPSCPTFMGFAVAAHDRPASGGRDATALSSFHMVCNHPPLHVDFKHNSALWNGSRVLCRLADTVEHCSRLLAFRRKSQAKSDGPSVLLKQVADTKAAGVRRIAYGKPWYSFSNLRMQQFVIILLCLDSNSPSKVCRNSRE